MLFQIMNVQNAGLQARSRVYGIHARFNSHIVFRGRSPVEALFFAHDDMYIV